MYKHDGGQALSKPLPSPSPRPCTPRAPYWTSASLSGISTAPEHIPRSSNSWPGSMPKRRCGREAEGNGLLNRHRGNPIVGSNPTVSASDPFQTDQAAPCGAEIPGISAGLKFPPQPLRLPLAQNSVSKAVSSHSDQTSASEILVGIFVVFQQLKIAA